VLERVARGDQAAFRQCMDEFGALVWGMARRFSRTAEDARDATQEIFLEIWRTASRFDAVQGTPKMFIAMIARRRLIDRLRKNKNDPELVSDEALASIAAAEPDPQISIDAQQAGEAMAQLRPEHRQVLELGLLQGLSQTEIASRLNLPLGTVKSFMRRGLIRIRELMRIMPEDLAPGALP
jgi:RNA polymerase sigma-70 factor, ECF subfamily